MTSNSDSTVSLTATTTDDPLSNIPTSQSSLPPTEPASPLSASFQTELNDRPGLVIPASITPPPSTQTVAPKTPVILDKDAIPETRAGAFLSSQPSNPFSPPATGDTVKFRGSVQAGLEEYMVPDKKRIDEAGMEELREMLIECAAECSRVKMEVTHHKFQLNLASLQAADDAERANVEHEMALKEVETLRNDQNIRQTRKDLSSAADSTHAKYLQLKSAYDEALEDIQELCKKLKTAKKVIRQSQDEIEGLRETNSQLLNRIRENREHFNILRSPGGLLHNALTSGGHNGTKATPRSRVAGRAAVDSAGQEPLAALLQALEKNSAPATPVAPSRSRAGRSHLKHTRNVQSLSSLPMAPVNRPQDPGALLPSIDIVPQTEPPKRMAKQPQQQMQPQQTGVRSRSRESTISASERDGESEELARRAMSMLSRGVVPGVPGLGAGRGVWQVEQQQSSYQRGVPGPSPSPSPGTGLGPGPETVPTVPPGYEVAKRAVQLQETVMGGLSTPMGVGPVVAGAKRRYNEGGSPGGEPLRDILASPLKKARIEEGVEGGMGRDLEFGTFRRVRDGGGVIGKGDCMGEELFVTK